MSQANPAEILRAEATSNRFLMRVAIRRALASIDNAMAAAQRCVYEPDIQAMLDDLLKAQNALAALSARLLA